MIDLLYGDTVSGKTTALENLAHHVHETTGKKTRVYIGDGGADSYDRRGLVTAGIIEIMDFSSREWPMTVLKLMSDYWFLKDPKDPNSQLVAPPANLFDTHGLMIFEGGAVIKEWLLDDVKGGLAWQAATGSGFGGVKDEDDNLSVKDDYKGATDGDTLHGANAPKHYQIVQARIKQAIRSSKRFPGMVLWTSHPTEGPDRTEGGESGQYGKITGKKIIGPDMGGPKQVSLIGREFGNVLHFDAVNLKSKELDPTSKKQVSQVDYEFRLYTRRHYDPNQDVLIEYVAGNRAADPKLVNDYYVSKEPGDSLLQFYAALAAARKSRLAKQESV